MAATAYVTQDDLASKVAPAFILASLDDDADGAEETGLWDKVVAQVEEAINCRLAPRYAVPFAAPLPYLVKEAAAILAAEALWLRRERTGEQNPWTKQAQAMRDRLERIGAGQENLDGAEPEETAEGGAVTEELKTYDATGRTML